MYYCTNARWWVRILFLHNNYPAQFRGLLQYFSGLGHEIVFVSLEANNFPVKGVKHLKIKTNIPIERAPSAKKINHNYKMLERKLSVAEKFFGAFKKLKHQGFVPDLVISHSGWGCAVHLKAIFPHAKLASYAEWWFEWDAEEFTFDQNSPRAPDASERTRLAERYLNLQLSLELADSDFIWSPTHYQKNLFPPLLRENITVLHEGVDLGFFKPLSDDLYKETLLTYATRGMEPMRGFDYFAQINAILLRRNKKFKAVIGGKDKAFYRPNPGKKTYGDMAKELFKEHGIDDRVQWPGLLDLKSYRKLLRSSHCHFYFTRPFVPSWSLVEAMACGCLIVASDIPCVREIVGTGDDSAAILVDHTKPIDVVDAVERCLQDPDLIANKRVAARQRASQYDKSVSVDKLATTLLSL